MADDHAKISLTVDASGAKAGLEEVKRVGDGLIGVARAVDAAQEKSATTTEQTEARKKVARGGGAKAAKELAEAEQDAAKRAGAGVAEATERILTSLSSQKRALDNNARAWDPLGAAAERAAHKIEVLFDIIAKKGPNAERAAGQVAQAVERAVAAASAANGTTQRQADKERLTDVFDPATASAKRMVAELAELNKAFQLGVNIAGGYTAAHQKIVDKYDEGAMAAKRAAVAQRELIEQARAAQNTLNAQAHFNETLGVMKPDETRKSARESGSVFEEQFAAQDAATAGLKEYDALLARLRNKFDPLTASAKAMAAELAELNLAQKLGINIAGGYEAAWQRIVDSYDDGAQAAKRVAEAQRELIEQARAAQNTLNAQGAFNQQLGIKEPHQIKSARESGDLFAEHARLTEKFDPAKASAQAFAEEIADLDKAVELGINIAEGYSAAWQRISEQYSSAAQTAKQLAEAQAELDRLTKIFDPAADAAKRMAAEIDDLNAAQKLGVNIADGYDAALQGIIEKYDEVGQAAKRAAADSKAMLEAYARGVDPLGAAVDDAEKRVAKFHKIIAEGGPNAAQATQLLPAAQNDLAAARMKQAAGDPKLIAERKALTAEFAPDTQKLQDYQAALQRVQRAQDLGIISDSHAAAERSKALNTYTGTTEALKKEEAELKKLTAEFAPLKEAEEAHLATLDRINKAMALGVIDDKQAETQRTLATKSFELQKKAIETHGHSAGQAAFAQRQFNVQMVQLFSSIESGQPILLSMIQQIHQMVDVALATGTGFSVVGTAIKSAFGAIFSPIGLIVGISAALAVMAYRAEETARRVGALREQLGGIRDDAPQASQMAEEAAKHLAATTPLHYTDALKGAGEILKVPEFHGNQQQMEELLQTADKLSIRMNEDMPAGLQRLTQAMRHPSQAAQDLVGHLKGFDQPLVNAIKRMEDAGKTADAFDLYLAAANRATRDATREVTPLTEALEKLTEAFSGAWHGSHSFADELGTGLVGQIAEVVKNIKDLMTGIQEMVTWLDQNTPDWLKNAATYKIPDPGAAAGQWLRQQIIGGGSTGQQVIMDHTGKGHGYGMFMLERGAATDVGMKIAPEGVAPTAANDERFDTRKNIIGGLQYFKLKLKDFQNDLDDATRAYNAGTEGARKGGGKGYLEAVKAQDVSKLPEGAKADIELLFRRELGDIQRSAMGPAALHRLEQIAMQESGGRQFETAKKVDEPAGAKGAPGGVPGGDAPLVVKPSGMSDQDKVNQGLDVTRTMGVEPVERTEWLGKIQKIRDGLAALSKQGKQGTADWIELSRGLEIAQLRFQEAIEPADKLTHSLDRGIAGTTRLTDAYRKNAESVAHVTAHNRALEEARTLAAEGTQKNIDLVETLTQKYLAEADATQQQELAKQVTDINFLIEGQERLNAAYEQSTAAGIKMTIQLKAEADARALARAGLANYADAVKLLVARNVELAQSQAVGQVKQQMLVNDNQITLINAETKALTMASGEREAYLAQVRSEIFLKEKGLSTNNAVAQGLIRSNQALAAGTLAAQNQKKALDEITQTGEQIFGTLEKGLTEPLREGETAAQRFGSVMTSVLTDIQKELLKLAVINPIMNALFKGEHRPEIGDLGGLGGLLGGDKDGKGGGALGALGKLFGFGGDSGGGRQGIISADRAGMANEQFGRSLVDKLIQTTGTPWTATQDPSGGMPGGQWTATPGAALPANMNAPTAPGGGNYTTDNPAMKGLTPAQIIQQEHDQHERSMGGQRSDLGAPSTVKIPARLDQPAMSIPVPDSGQIDKAPVFGQPGSFDPQALVPSVGDRLSGAFDDYLKTSGDLAHSTDKLVNSLGDQVSTIKDQVGSIDNLVDAGQNQVSAIGNLITVIGSGGGGGGGGPDGSPGGGGILGSLMKSVTGSLGAGGGGGAGGGDGMASGGELADLSSMASSNVSAGAAGLHGGGLVGYDSPSFTRMVDPAIFAGAPRFHEGLAPDEIPAILQKGERVLTHDQNQQLGALLRNFANSRADPAATSGDSLIGQMFKHAGGVTGWAVDKLGGEGFYKGGGLIGSMFKGSGSPSTGGSWLGGLLGGRDAAGSYTGKIGDPIAGGDAISGQMASMSDNQLAQIADTSADAMGAGWSSGAASAADSAFDTVGSGSSMFSGISDAFSGIGDSISSGWSSLMSLFHEGGVVGAAEHYRLVPASVLTGASRFHAGLGANEFGAILERGERVLTGQQQKQVHAAANNNNGGGGHNFTFNFPADASPDGFRRAGHQVATQVQNSLARAKARNSI